MKYLRTFIFLAVCILLSCEFACNPSHESIFSSEHLLSANAGELKSTVVSPHLEVSLDGDENILWCSTFQLAWNEACKLVGEDLHFYQEPAMVEILNKRTAKAGDIDSASYIALAGYIRDGILGRIRSELRQKFKGVASPRVIPDRVGLRPQDIVTYAYLFKNLEFPKKFEKLTRPIRFKNSNVACFGVGEKFKGAHIRMCEQVSILSYNSQDDFIIELQTGSSIDLVILARINPGSTLEATVAGVLEQVSVENPLKMQPGDILKVPKFNFDIHREYTELLRKKLRLRNPNIAKDLIVLSADQLIRFQMDEEGVKLRSESSMSFGCSVPYEPPAQHIMIFDKPFLVLLKNRGADVPYFAMWVGNPELLVPWK